MEMYHLFIQICQVDKIGSNRQENLKSVRSYHSKWQTLVVAEYITQTCISFARVKAVVKEK